LLPDSPKERAGKKASHWHRPTLKSKVFFVTNSSFWNRGLIFNEGKARLQANFPSSVKSIHKEIHPFPMGYAQAATAPPAIEVGETLLAHPAGLVHVLGREGTR